MKAVFLIAAAITLGTLSLYVNAQGSSPPTVSESIVKGHLLTNPVVVYPPLAQLARVQGAVVFDVVIAKNGSIKELQVVCGHPLLLPSATDAMKQATYAPFLVNGEPIEVHTRLFLCFGVCVASSESSAQLAGSGSNCPRVNSEPKPTPNPPGTPAIAQQPNGDLEKTSPSEQLHAQNSSPPDSNTTTGGTEVYRVGGDVTPPRAVYAPDPAYAEEARWARLQGKVVLRLVVSSDGEPQQIRVEHSLGMGLDEKSIEAVKLWRFEPARKGGTPVAVMINVEVNFKLTNDGVVSVEEGGRPQRDAPVSSSTVAQSTSAPQYIDDGVMPRIRIEECCATPAQEMLYCHRWTIDRGHISDQIPQAACCGGGRWHRCSILIVKTDEEQRMYGENNRMYTFTDDEVQVANKAIQDDKNEVAKRNFFELHKCTDQDPRGAAQSALDPECVRRKQVEARQRAERDGERKLREAAQKAKQVAIARLGVYKGQSQTSAKAALQRDGFKMPWVCGGQWEGGTWLVGCQTYRNKDTITVVFSLYDRIRYVDPDTQVSRIVEKKTDKLILINYQQQ